MTDTFNPTLKNRLARDVVARCQSLQFGVLPWLTLHFEDLDAVRRAHALTLDQLAEMLLEVAYIWRDGAALSLKSLRCLIDKVVAMNEEKRQRGLQTEAAFGD